MNVLSVTWDKILPAKFGGQKGSAGFNEALSKHVHIILLCSKNNDTEAGYSVLPLLPVSQKQFFNPFVWKKILRVCKQENITHIIFEHPYYGFLTCWMKKFTRYKLIVHSHNIEFLRYKSMGNKGWNLLKRLEKLAYKNADLVLFKTKQDADIATSELHISPGKCQVVPYGLSGASDVSFPITHVQLPLPVNHFTLLFAGTLDYLPNAKAVENIFKEIAPRLKEGFTIVICGRNRFKEFQYLKQLSHPRVRYEGEVDDIVTFFLNAHVFINPVTMHTGTQTKVLEAISLGMNVVIFKSQETGLEKGMETGKIFSVKDGDWDGFVNAIDVAISNKKETPQSFYEYYDWKRIVPDVVDRMRQL